MPFYKVNRLDRVTKATRRPPDTKSPMFRVSNNSLGSLITNINNSRLLTRSRTKLMRVRVPPSTPTVRAMVRDLTLVSFRVKCDRELTTFSDLLSRLEVKHCLLKHYHQAGLMHSLRV